MKQPLSRWFSALLAAALLLCSVTVAVSLFHQASVQAKISHVQSNLEAVQGRLRKQQLEYAQALEALPAVNAELESIQPAAQAAYEEEQALRQQRKELRAENAALADELSALTAQVAEAGEDAAQTADAVLQLDNALTELQSLYQLYE